LQNKNDALSGLLSDVGQYLQSLSPSARQLSEWDISFAILKMMEEVENPVRQLKECVAADGRFSALLSGWIETDSGGHALGDHALSLLLVRQIYAGKSPEKLIAEVLRSSERRNSNLSNMFVLSGAAVTKKLRINASVSIIPWNKVAECTSKDEFDPSAPGWRDKNSSVWIHASHIHPGCALQIEDGNTLEVIPLGYATRDFVDGHERARNQLEIVDDFCRCAAILKGSLVECLGSWEQIEDRLLGDLFGNRISIHRQVPSFKLMQASSEPVELNAGEFKKYFLELRAFNDANSVRRAIDRLRSAFRKNLNFEKVADIGIALEILLLHGSGDDRGELSYRLSMRGAALLERTGPKRHNVFRQLRKLYNLRSTAVHAGHLSAKQEEEANELMPIVIGYAVRIVRLLIKRGKFPDWESEVVFT
jgi:hypothetical protein